MQKKAHQYKITLEYLKDKEGKPMEEQPIEFHFDNHDNLFGIINKLQERDFFEDQGQSTEFALGLKLFTEVILKNRNHLLFEEFGSAMGAFMKKMKSSL